MGQNASTSTLVCAPEGENDVKTACLGSRTTASPQQLHALPAARLLLLLLLLLLSWPNFWRHGALGGLSLLSQGGNNFWEEQAAVPFPEPFHHEYSMQPHVRLPTGTTTASTTPTLA